MMTHPFTYGRTLAVLALACAMAAFLTAPATAQTARKLKCTGCVKSKQIKNGAITGTDIKNNTIGGGKIQGNAVTAAKIANGAVGLGKLSPDVQAQLNASGSGDITGVTAGTGLSGGGTSGDVTLDVNFGVSGKAETAARSDHTHNGETIDNGSITAADLAADSVGASELRNNAVSGSNIIDNTLTSNDLAANSVGGSELKLDSVSGDNVLDNSLTANDLATNSVGALELGSNAVNGGNVINNSLTANDLASNSVGASELGSNAVGSANVIDNSLTAADLATGSVGSSEVAAESIPAADLSNEAGLDFSVTPGAGVSVSLAVDPAWSSIRSVALTTPAGSGFVHCICSGSIDIDQNFFAGEVRVGVDNDNLNSTDPNSFVVFDLPSGAFDGASNIPLTAQHTFAAPAGGGTVSYACTGQILGGLATDIDFDVNNFVCMFFPTRY